MDEVCEKCANAHGDGGSCGKGALGVCRHFVKAKCLDCKVARCPMYGVGRWVTGCRLHRKE